MGEVIIICAVCEKRTRNGRVPKGGTGDYRYPSRHKGPDGLPCVGNLYEGEWADDNPGPASKSVPS